MKKSHESDPRIPEACAGMAREMGGCRFCRRVLSRKRCLHHTRPMIAPDILDGYVKTE